MEPFPQERKKLPAAMPENLKDGEKPLLNCAIRQYNIPINLLD